MIGYTIQRGYHVLDVGTLPTVDDCLTYAREFCAVEAGEYWLHLDNGYKFKIETYSSRCLYVLDEFCGTLTKYFDGIGYLLTVTVEDCETIGHFV